MAHKSLLVIGSGKRVQEAALPALQLIPDISIHKILARSGKSITSGSKVFEVEAFSSLKASDIQTVDLIYMAVKQPGVADVLVKLSSYDLAGVDLLIETPVIPFSDLRYFNLFDNFRNVWVAEDCTKLPCFDLMNRGAVDSVNLDRAGYKYHGIALLKQLLNCSEITSARRKRKEGGVTRDCFSFSNQKTGFMTSPRNYLEGTFAISTADNTISDSMGQDERTCLIKPVLENGHCKGFTINDQKSYLEECETQLLGDWVEGASITSKMHDLKRVGLYRMFKDILEERGSYPLAEATHDMTVSYFLDNLGIYKNIFLMNHNSQVGRQLMRAVLLAKRILERVFKILCQ